MKSLLKEFLPQPVVSLENEAENSPVSPENILSDEEVIAQGEVFNVLLADDAETSTLTDYLPDETDVTELLELSTALEDIYNSLVMSDTGELTDDAANILHSVVADHVEQTDLNICNPVVSPEAFKINRVVATESTIDSIGYTLQQIWQHIKAAMLAVWAQLKKFFAWARAKMRTSNRDLTALKKDVAEAKGTKGISSVRVSIKVDARAVKRLWNTDDNGISKDIARDLDHIRSLFPKLIAPMNHETSLWAKNQSENLVKMADGLTKLQRPEARAKVVEFKNSFEIGRNGLLGAIYKYATPCVGNYLGGLVVVQSGSPIRHEAVNNTSEGEIHDITLREVDSILTAMFALGKEADEMFTIFNTADNDVHRNMAVLDKLASNPKGGGDNLLYAISCIQAEATAFRNAYNSIGYCSRILSTCCIATYKVLQDRVIPSAMSALIKAAEEQA